MKIVIVKSKSVALIEWRKLLRIKYENFIDSKHYLKHIRDYEITCIRAANKTQIKINLIHFDSYQGNATIGENKQAVYL